MTAQSVKSNNNSLLLGLISVAVVMLCFGLFAMRPLYGIWCRLSGTQMKPDNNGALTAGLTNRFITTYFEAVNFDDLPVRFWPDETTQNVQVGAEVKNAYHFENMSDHTVHFRPIHQVSPIEAGKHFGMRICFCFTNQSVGPHETKVFPVVYRFDSGLDPRTRSVTLRYGLFAIDPEKPTDPTEIKLQEERLGSGIVSPGTMKGSP